MKALPWILCIVLLGVLGWQQFRRIPSRHETVWDTIPIYDTITHDTVIPRDSIVLRYEVVNLPMVGNISRKNILENGNIALASLDSIRVFPKSYVLQPKATKSKRWVLSVGAGAGWNPFTRKFEPTIGINIGLKLWEW